MSIKSNNNNKNCLVRNNRHRSNCKTHGTWCMIFLTVSVWFRAKTGMCIDWTLHARAWCFAETDDPICNNVCWDTRTIGRQILVNQFLSPNGKYISSRPLFFSTYWNKWSFNQSLRDFNEILIDFLNKLNEILLLNVIVLCFCFS